MNQKYFLVDLYEHTQTSIAVLYCERVYFWGVDEFCGNLDKETCERLVLTLKQFSLSLHSYDNVLFSTIYFLKNGIKGTP